MIYGSVCSGIEAATVAWEPLGWKPAFFSEIEAFPRAVLAHHYPQVPLHGDFTTIEGGEYGPIDLLVGGTPCQDFSIAGLRAGIAGDRGNLTLEFLRLAARAKPRWIVWENVPGVLSSDGGRALGAFLGGLAELGYGFAYRVLDAQYTGLAQRRERVFVVGHLGDWRRAAAVLLERESLRWDSPPRREAGEGVAASIRASASPRGHGNSHGLRGDGSDNLVAHTLKGEGFDASEDGTGRGVPLVLASGQANAEVVSDGEPSLTCLHEAPIVAFSVKDHGADAGPISPTLRAGGFDKSHANGGVMPAVAFSIMPMNSGKDYKARAVDVAQPIMAGGPVGGNQGGDYVVQPVAFDMRGREGGAQFEGPHDTANIRAASGGSSRSYVAGSVVRRLTPRECERLQGFPDGYTDIPWRKKNWTPDGPRYKALGNSMAVPCMRWIGERIQMVDQLAEDP